MRTTISIITILSLCSISLFAQTSYVKQYSGSYNIGQDAVEAYALREDGTCTWVYGWISGGNVQSQKKYGTWAASEGYIKISIKGKTGVIVEEYILKSKRFTNKTDSSRYLIRNK